MLNRFCIKLVNFLLKRNLTLEQRNDLIVHIMDTLQVLPISSIITTSNDGQILLGGNLLDIDKIKQLKESARVALDNVSLKVINQEVLYMAVVGGLHKATTPEDLYFYRAAIWFAQQVENQLKILAQREESIIN